MMYSARLTRFAAALAALLATSPSPCRATDTAPPEAPPKWTITGLADWYYQFSLNHPDAGANLAGRAFDIKNDAFALSLAEVTINKPTTDASPFGLTATLTFGKSADLVHLYEPGGAVTHALYNDAATKYVQQLYGTYVLSGTTPVTVDLGKFVTHMGYEVIESSSNDSYSRSFLFTYAIPLYHAGLRLTAPIGKGLTGQLLLVNGWNDIEDDNGGKSIGAQLNYKPSDKLNVLLNYLGGNEGGKALGSGVYSGIGFPDALERNTQVVDLVAVYNPCAKVKLGLNADYGGAFRQGSSGTWSGQAYYARYQASPSTAVALRYERFQDSGLRLGAGTQLTSLTATLEYTIKGNLINRLEFRHDHSGNAAAFAFPSGGGGSANQDTLTLSQVFKF